MNKQYVFNELRDIYGALPKLLEDLEGKEAELGLHYGQALLPINFNCYEAMALQTVLRELLEEIQSE